MFFCKENICTTTERVEFCLEVYFDFVLKRTKVKGRSMVE